MQYFRTIGDENALRYPTSEPVMVSATVKPDTKGWVAELNWLPIEVV